MHGAAVLRVHPVNTGLEAMLRHAISETLCETLEAALSEDEIKRRRTELKPFTPKVTTGYLKRYAESVQNAGTGAVVE